MSKQTTVPPGQPNNQQANAPTTPKQIMLPGTVLDDTGSACDGTICINLDDQSRLGGRPISNDVFEQFVRNYNIQPDLQTRPHQHVAYVIDKQLLLILLSSKNCTGLLLCKCRRDPNDPTTESIAFMAVDSKGSPLRVSTGEVAPPNSKAASTVDVSAGEWIQGLTVKEELERGIIGEHALDKTGFDFASYLEALSKKGQGLL